MMLELVKLIGLSAMRTYACTSAIYFGNGYRKGYEDMVDLYSYVFFCSIKVVCIL